MVYRVIAPDDFDWMTRPHAPNEAARHVAELSELAGFAHTRANVWRYEPGDQGTPPQASVSRGDLRRPIGHALDVPRGTTGALRRACWWVGSRCARDALADGQSQQRRSSRLRVRHATRERDRRAFGLRRVTASSLAHQSKPRPTDGRSAPTPTAWRIRPGPGAFVRVSGLRRFSRWRVAGAMVARTTRCSRRRLARPARRCVSRS